MDITIIITVSTVLNRLNPNWISKGVGLVQLLHDGASMGLLSKQ
jgi:hypothetical protein